MSHECPTDSPQAELTALKASKQGAASTTIPVPAQAPEAQASGEVVIPHELLPILSVLRDHISELTRDNQALRYTFGLESSPSSASGPIASSSKVKLDPSLSTPTAGGARGPEGGESVPPKGIPGLDLEAVVTRVKELVRENDELGNMVIELGRGSTEEYESALEGECSVTRNRQRFAYPADEIEESKRVITSLEYVKSQEPEP